MGSGGKVEPMGDASTCTSSTLYQSAHVDLPFNSRCSVFRSDCPAGVKRESKRDKDGIKHREKQWLFSPRVASHESTCVIDALLTLQRACYRKKIQWGVEEKIENGQVSY